MKKKPLKKSKDAVKIKKISFRKKKKALSKKSLTTKKKLSLSAQKKSTKKQSAHSVSKTKAKKNLKKSKKSQVVKKIPSPIKKKKPFDSTTSKTKINLKSKVPIQQKNSQKLSKSEELTVNRVKEELQKIEERKQEKKLILKDMEGRDYCLFEDCDFPAIAGEYCRLHYIGRWDYIRTREKLLKIGFIEKKMEEILKKSSPNCITHFLGDFRSEKNFLTRIKPLLEDIDNLNEEDLFVTENKDANYPEERY